VGFNGFGTGELYVEIWP